MKEIAIIGSGIAAMSVVMPLINNKKFKITVFESGGANKKNSNKTKVSVNKSFKYNSQEFKLSKEKFLKNFNIAEKNFFLSNVNLFGGLSNFWGGGIEVPDKKFLANNFYPKSIKNFYSKIKEIFNIGDKEARKFIDARKRFFYTLIDKLHSNEISIKNIDISLSGNKTLNTSHFFYNLFKKKSINLCLDHHVEKVNKDEGKYSVYIKSKKKNFIYNNKFDIVISCAGTIASTILVAKCLNLKEKKIRFYNNPMLQICFFSPKYYLKHTDNSSISHPLKIIHYKNQNLEVKGSLMPLIYFSNCDWCYAAAKILSDRLVECAGKAGERIRQA
jgi:hypothetical protein